MLSSGSGLLCPSHILTRSQVQVPFSSGTAPRAGVGKHRRLEPELIASFLLPSSSGAGPELRVQLEVTFVSESRYNSRMAPQNVFITGCNRGGCLSQHNFDSIIEL